MSVVVKLNPAVEKRLEQSGGVQPRRGACVICGENWEDCPHTRAQTYLIEQAYELKQTLS